MSSSEIFQPQKRYRPFLKWLTIVVGVTIAHYILASISQSVSFENGASSIWPSSGFYLALVWLFGYKLSLPILLGELIINRLVFYQDLPTIIGISAISTLEPLITGYLLRHFVAPQKLFERSQNMLKFLVLILPSPVVTTSLSVVVLCLTGKLPWEFYGAVWKTWSISVITGRLIITPAILAWRANSKQHKQAKSGQFVLERGVVIGLLISISYMAFWVGSPVEYMMLSRSQTTR